MSRYPQKRRAREDFIASRTSKLTHLSPGAQGVVFYVAEMVVIAPFLSFFLLENVQNLRDHVD